MAAYFFDCPDTATWSIRRKRELHVQIFDYVVYMHCVYGLVRGVRFPPGPKVSTSARKAAAGLKYDAVALWMPPSSDTRAAAAGWRHALRLGLLWRLQRATRSRLSAEGRARLFGEFFPLLHRTKAEVLAAQDPHAWYLVYLGTRGRARGKGLGTALVQEITKQVSESVLAVA